MRARNASAPSAWEGSVGWSKNTSMRAKGAGPGSDPMFSRGSTGGSGARPRPGPRRRLRWRVWRHRVARDYAVREARPLRSRREPQRGRDERGRPARRPPLCPARRFVSSRVRGRHPAHGGSEPASRRLPSETPSRPYPAPPPRSRQAGGHAGTRRRSASRRGGATGVGRRETGSDRCIGSAEPPRRRARPRAHGGTSPFPSYAPFAGSQKRPTRATNRLSGA